jgi:hypothetical protein
MYPKFKPRFHGHHIHVCLIGEFNQYINFKGMAPFNDRRINQLHDFNVAFPSLHLRISHWRSVLLQIWHHQRFESVYFNLCFSLWL